MTSRRNSTRGVGWGAGWKAPYEPPKDVKMGSESKGEPYSYLASAGYCRLALSTVRQATGRHRDTDFSDLFEEPCDVRLDLDANQRAALLEISRTPVTRLVELGIIKPDEGPEETAPGWE